MIDTTKLKFDGTIESIQENRKLIETALAEAKAQIEVLRALSTANQSLCKHKGRTGYTERDGSYDYHACFYCGSSR